MAGLASGMNSKFNFTKTDKFLSGNASISLDLDASPSPAVALAIANDTAFPAGTIRLGNLNFKASAGSGAIKFGGGDTKGAVSFSGSGDVRAGLGVYASSADMFADLGGDAKLFDEVAFNDTGVHRYVTLYWGYDIKAALKGSVALGAGGAVKFGMDGASEGAFAFVRAYDAEPNARTAIADVVESWRLPRQIDDFAQLQPGTWAIAEVDGQFAAAIGAQYGYNFNWIHKVGLQGLSGDIGVKIQAAVEFELGFSASGKYLVIVGRDSLNPADEVLRVRLHKLSKRGFSFALNASLGVTGTTGKLLPQQLDQLIAGLFGTAAPQVVSDLKVLRSIADPSVPLNKLAGDFLVDFAEKELNTIVDVKQKFNEAQARIVKFLDVWDHLGDKASAILWDAAGKADPNFKTVIDALATAGGDPSALKKIVSTEFAKADFFRSRIGQFLESQASNSVVALLASNADLSKIGDIAKKVQEVLDGKVITNLTKFIDDRLGLDKIRDLTLDKIDDRLKEKLADFLAKPLDNAGLQDIRATIGEIIKKADKLYAEALKALNHTYSFELHASYQKTTTKDALIDASFDFKQNASLSAAVIAAIDGDFTSLLSKAPAGLLLNSATMTHGVTRQASVSFSMPYFSSSSVGLNTAIASLDVKAEDGGLFMFDLKASDKQTQIRNNQNRWSSRLAVGMKVASLASGIRDSGNLEKLGKEMTAGYGFCRAATGLGSASLLHQLEPLQQTYFPNQFSVPGKPSLFDWVTDLDKVADSVENNGTGLIGNTLISLDIAVPGTVLAGWLNAPAKDKDPAYLKMSLAVQAALKRLIPYCYFQDVSRYKGANAAAAAVLVYSAIPPLNQMHLDSGTAVANSSPSYYWDVFDPDLLRAVVLKNQETINNLASNAAGIRRLLSSTDRLHGDAQFYETSEVGKILNASLSGTGLIDLKSLLFTEAEVLKSAVEAGQSMANFRRTAADQPAKALEELAEFGHHLTEAFNGKLTDLFNAKDEPDLLRNFGTLVFLEASRQLQPGLGDIDPTAVLDVSIVRTKTDTGPVVFPPKDFPDNDPLPAGSIALEQRVLSIA